MQKVWKRFMLIGAVFLFLSPAVAYSQRKVLDLREMLTAPNSVIIESHSPGSNLSLRSGTPIINLVEFYVRVLNELGATKKVPLSVTEETV